jgi:hypothetical protein
MTKVAVEDTGAELAERITSVFREAEHKAVALIHGHVQTAHLAPSESLPEWMTDVQLARYWQIINKDGEPVTAGLRKWAKRSADEFPLPHAYMGDLMRFHRDEVDQWAKEEAQRRRAQQARSRIRDATFTSDDPQQLD